MLDEAHDENDWFEIGGEYVEVLWGYIKELQGREVSQRERGDRYRDAYVELQHRLIPATRA